MGLVDITVVNVRLESSQFRLFPLYCRVRVTLFNWISALNTTKRKPQSPQNNIWDITKCQCNVIRKLCPTWVRAYIIGLATGKDKWVEYCKITTSEIQPSTGQSAPESEGAGRHIWFNIGILLSIKLAANTSKSTSVVTDYQNDKLDRKM